MKKILVINASARGERSHSRRLTDVFVEYYKECKPESPIKFRDLGTSNIPHINEKWIAGAFKPEGERTIEETEALKFSAELIKELKNADVIVLGSPMYNWSVPSVLKAYIDQVLRVNETWEVNREDQKNPYIGLLKNKSLYLLLSRGAQGYEKGGYNEHMNFQSDYLKTVFNIIGITDIEEVSVNGEAFGSEEFELARKNSKARIKELIKTQLL
ncbi:FMN-dependent NADH-azoreductase [Flavobacterium sp. HTF]|uniref:FMN-dependent NADH-azoreductase n=1 Tax=Flavobacterium sp. HTF TaxID=2170732 RepID=UPI000D5F6397|nr:NAD(P)H-dependent oxidoreductase [Flavobacterium sp. HTF]PWB27307.1 NAD(P)H dehydrogenase [Flavobacterium sp. HTF]